MKVHFQMLRHVPRFRDLMRRDGWNLELQHDDSLIAVHPYVTDSFEARQRLNRLGFLTSRAMRIQFPLPVTDERAELIRWDHAHE